MTLPEFIRLEDVFYDLRSVLVNYDHAKAGKAEVFAVIVKMHRALHDLDGKICESSGD